MPDRSYVVQYPSGASMEFVVHEDRDDPVWVIVADTECHISHFSDSRSNVADVLIEARRQGRPITKS